MKYSNKIRGMSTALAFAFAFMVFSFSFAPKAHAADASIGISYGAYAIQPAVGTVIAQSEPYYILNNNVDTPIVNGSVTIVKGSSRRVVSDAYFVTEPTITFTGPTKVYMSYYPTGDAGRVSVTEYGNYDDTSTWNVTYLNQYNQLGYVVSVNFEDFTTASSLTGRGYAIEASFQGTETNAIRSLKIQRSNFENGFSNSAAQAYPANLYFPSIRIITTEYSAEMESLDNIANSIVAQNDLLLAMKGDIVAILQDIYEMTGDLWIAQDLTNQYLSAMLPLLENIDQTTTNIYALLGSQLAALETAINTSASTIEAAIEAQTAAMIAYLEELFNTNNEVPSETYEQQQDAENILDQMESLEKPDVETIVPEIDDYSDGGVSGVMSAIFSSNLIVTMMTLSASLAFGAYVLFGKRS